MKKFARTIARHPKTVLMICLGLAVAAGMMSLVTPMNYDLFSYIPDSVEAVKGQVILSEEFHTADTAFIMVDSVDVPKVLSLKKALSKIDGVGRASWITDVVDPAVPDFMVPGEILGIFKTDSHSLIQVVFSHPSASEETQKAMEEISFLLEPGTVSTGMPVFLYELKALVEEQKLKSVIVAVLLSAIMTAIATGSAMVPVVFLTAIGVGILFNMGTNFFFGSISYLTGAIAAVIQLGVTFDFSIFLMHRYREEHFLHADKAEAMALAIGETFRAVFPAALTTMAGFLALGFMKVKIGLDMGLVMSKGVFMGMITSLTVLPSLILIFDRFIRIRDPKHAAKPLEKIAGGLIRHAGLITIVFVLLFVPMIYSRSQTQLSYGIHSMLPQTLPALKAIENIEEEVGSVEMANVLFPEETPRWAQAKALDAVQDLPGVDAVLSLEKLADPAIPRAFIPEAATAQFIQGGWENAIVKLNVKPGTDEGNETVEGIRTILHNQGLYDTIVTGTAAISKDLVDLSTKDIAVVNWISLGAILLIVALVFRSASIPVILIAGIQLAILVNLSIPYWTGTEVPYITFTAISSIQLGTTVDYAILMMSRYRSERKSKNPRPAMLSTITGSTPAILTSGLSLCAATVGLIFISDVATIQTLAAMIARGALISMGVIVLMLPAVILTFDRVICATSAGWKKEKKPKSETMEMECAK